MLPKVRRSFNYNLAWTKALHILPPTALKDNTLSLISFFKTISVPLTIWILLLLKGSCLSNCLHLIDNKPFMNINNQFTTNSNNSAHNTADSSPSSRCSNNLCNSICLYPWNRYEDSHNSWVMIHHNRDQHSLYKCTMCNQRCYS